MRLAMMLEILSLLHIIQSANSYHLFYYGRHAPTSAPRYIYRPPHFYQSIQNYLFRDVYGGGVTSQTPDVNADGRKRKLNAQEILKEYVYTMLLVKLLTETEGTAGEDQSENAPFQRTDALPSPETAMNSPPTIDSTSTAASPTTSQVATTEDHYGNWIRVGRCRYQAVVDQRNYYYAKKDCASIGASLATPGLIKAVTDMTSFTTKLGLIGVAYWVGVEEDSNGSDVTSDEEPRYSQNSRFPDQECLAIVAQPNAVLNSYMSCLRITPAYVCQVCDE